MQLFGVCKKFVSLVWGFPNSGKGWGESEMLLGGGGGLPGEGKNLVGVIFLAGGD